MELELTLRFSRFLHFFTRVEGAGYFRIALVLFRNPVQGTFSSSWSYYASPAAAHFPISAISVLPWQQLIDIFEHPSWGPTSM